MTNLNGKIIKVSNNKRKELEDMGLYGVEYLIFKKEFDYMMIYTGEDYDGQIDIGVSLAMERYSSKYSVNDYYDKFLNGCIEHICDIVLDMKDVQELLDSYEEEAYKLIKK